MADEKQPWPSREATSMRASSPAATEATDAAPEPVTPAELGAALARGAVEVRLELPKAEELLTADRVRRFLLGELTWAQLLGMTQREAYGIAGTGYGFYEQGRLEEARTVFEALVLSNPSDAYFHDVLGAVYQQLGHEAEALGQYGLAIALDDASRHALMARGELLMKSGRLEEALLDFEAALALVPSSADRSSVRARALASAATIALGEARDRMGPQAGEELG